MINIAKAQEQLTGLVGWKNALPNPSLPDLDDDNKASSSSLYFDSLPGVISLWNVYQTMPLYVFEADNLEQEFNSYLTEKTRAATESVLSWLANRIKKDQPTDLIDSASLYWLPTSYATECSLIADSFVGYRIEVPAEVSVQIPSIVLECNEGETLDLFLIDAQTREVTTLENMESAAGVSCSNSVDIKLTSGVYYLGYFSTEAATLRPVNRQGDGAMMTRFNGIKVDRIRMLNYTYETCPDPENVEYTDQSFGINFDVTSWRDVTDVITKGKDQFAKALQLQTVHDHLSVMLSTNRTNRDERLINQAQVDLDGIAQYEVVPGRKGITKQLNEELENLYNRLFGGMKIKTVTT